MLPTNPAALPYVVANITGGIGTGTGGTNGTYAGGVSGGPLGFAWTYTIAGGALSNYTITNRGVAVANTAPTLSLPSGGLTGATVPTATTAVIPVSGTFWAITADSVYVALWQNSASSLAAVNKPDATQVKVPLTTATLTQSSLAQVGSDLRSPAVLFSDPNQRALLTGWEDGSLSFKLDTLSPAATWINSQIAASAFTLISGLSWATAGTVSGSPIPNSFAMQAQGLGGKLAFGVGGDGAFFIGKYDANLAGAVAASVGGSCAPEAQPFVYDTANVVYAVYTGSNVIALTSTATDGNCTNARRFSDRIAYLSDVYRGLIQPYTMKYDGTSKRAMLRSALWEGTFVIGQSNGVGWDTNVTAATKVPIYPGKALKLQGGPVVNAAVAGTISPTAQIDDLYERNNATLSSGFASALLDTELANRPTLKHVCFGNARGGAAYSAIKKGTADYTDVINQAARLTTLAAAQSSNVIVRGIHLMHGGCEQQHLFR